MGDVLKKVPVREQARELTRARAPEDRMTKTEQSALVMKVRSFCTVSL